MDMQGVESFRSAASTKKSEVEMSGSEWEHEDSTGKTARRRLATVYDAVAGNIHPNE
jgi:hypothetical protein